jgi:hypothetical protein
MSDKHACVHTNILTSLLDVYSLDLIRIRPGLGVLTLQTHLSASGTKESGCCVYRTRNIRNALPQWLLHLSMAQRIANV